MTRRRPYARRLARAFLGLTLVTSVVVLPALEARAAFVTPALVRSIGGTGRAALFPWGMAFNPVTHEYVVSDYLNYQLRRYSADGSYLGDLLQPTGADGDPESVLGGVAVDPTNGDVYVTKPKPDTLAHYDAAGTVCPTSRSIPAASRPRRTSRGSPWTTPDTSTRSTAAWRAARRTRHG